MPKQEPRIKTKLFKNGRSQAVRLPKALRFESEEVYLWREGNRIIIESVETESWPDGYWDAMDQLPDLEINELKPAFLDLDLE
jgi:antitoxin VapB